MTDFSKRLALTIGLIFILLGSAFLVPTIIVSTQENETKTLHQELDIIHTVKSPLTSTVTNLDNNNNTTIVLYNDETSDSTRITNLNLSETRSITLSGETINVSYQDYTSNSNIVLKYEFPVYFGWPEGSDTIYNNLGFIMLSMITLFIVGFILVVIGVYD